MSRWMNEELATRNHNRRVMGPWEELESFARDNDIPFERPQRKHTIRSKPRGLTGKQWNQRKSRNKMAKRSRKMRRA